MNYERVYFLGIGGIGMSALARYFMHERIPVAGYDRTPSPLTLELEAEGAQIHYTDDVSLIDERFLDSEKTLVIYTPALPHDHTELTFMRDNGFYIIKRSRALGELSKGKYVMAVAGTHGKTTTTTLTAWLNHIAGGGGSAFLGGISRNFNSNLVLGKTDRLAVEADEFDRSFLQLYPDAAVITSTDADHLDIYGTHEAMLEAFSNFVWQIKPNGTLILKYGVNLRIDNKDIKVYNYSFDTPCDFYARNIALKEGGYYSFDLVTPSETLTGCTLGIPGWVNIENAVAATALLWVAGYDKDLLKKALAEFAGVKRRFEFYINTPQLTYMDDYAHHPQELHAAITSLRGMFPGRKITAVFQPHLYTRTRDFYREFARELSLADHTVLLPIYPARELPIEGVNSRMIADLVTAPCDLIEKEQLIEYLAQRPLDVIATFGAGDIDRYCLQIYDMLELKRQ